MKALLALEDGTLFPGTSFTGEGETSGEVIFNTGLTGYQEVLTDPSYVGQMVCMTYPHIGNYGVNPDDVESEKIRVEGFIVKECCKEPSNHRSVQSVPDYLREAGVLGVEGVDTRALTRHLRLAGAMRGVMSTRVDDPDRLVELAQSGPSMEGLDLASSVTPDGPYTFDGRAKHPVDVSGGYQWPGVNGASAPKVCVFDFGIKWNILRLLKEQGLDLLMLPSTTSLEQVRELGPDLVFLSPGPGDPAALGGVIDEIGHIAKAYPMAGICLGHQLLGRALGGSTSKLAFGHHGANHPVQDLTTGKVEVTSQNHGFVVDLSGVTDVEATHINLNDRTLEGFRHKRLPIITLQFHPEAGPGPHDSRYFFSRVRRLAETGKDV